MKVLFMGANRKNDSRMKADAEIDSDASIDSVEDAIDSLVKEGAEILVDDGVSWVGEIARERLAVWRYRNVTVYRRECEGADMAVADGWMGEDVDSPSVAEKGSDYERSWTARTIARDGTECHLGDKAEGDVGRCDEDGGPLSLFDEDGNVVEAEFAPVLKADACINPVVRAMAIDADEGVVFWDEADWGSFSCILMLVALGKPINIVAYSRTFYFDPLDNETGADSYGDFRFDELRRFAPERNPEHRTNDQGLPPDVQREYVERCMPSHDMDKRLVSCDLTKTDIIAMIIGSRCSLYAKRYNLEASVRYDDVINECIDEAESAMRSAGGGRAWQTLGPARIAQKVEGACKKVLASSFSVHAKVINDALDALRETGEGFFYLKRAFYNDPYGYDYEEEDIGPFNTEAQACVALEAAEDRSFKHDLGYGPLYWGVLEKWQRRKVRDSTYVWDNPYTYYISRRIRQDVCFFDENRYDKQLGCWRAPDEQRWWPFMWIGYGGDFAGDLEAPTPFQVGDLVTLDCRPFAPLSHCLVLAPDRADDASFPRVLGRDYGTSDVPEENRWKVHALKRGGGLSVGLPGYSVLYHAEVCHGYQLWEHEAVLDEVQQWLGRSDQRAGLLMRTMSQHPEGMSDAELRAFIEGAA